MMSEMVERVARALFPVDPDSDTEMTVHGKWLRPGIPREQILSRLHGSPFPATPVLIRDKRFWQAGIDAALADEALK